MLCKRGDILKGRTPGEQMTSVGYFLAGIEILRNEGVAFILWYTATEGNCLYPSGLGTRKVVHLNIVPKGGLEPPFYATNSLYYSKDIDLEIAKIYCPNTARNVQILK